MNLEDIVLTNKPVTKKTRMYVSTYVRSPRGVNHRDRKQNSGRAPRAGGRGHGEFVFRGDRVSV